MRRRTHQHETSTGNLGRVRLAAVESSSRRVGSPPMSKRRARRSTPKAIAVGCGGRAALRGTRADLPVAPKEGEVLLFHIADVHDLSDVESERARDFVEEANAR